MKRKLSVPFLLALLLHLSLILFFGLSALFKPKRDVPKTPDIIHATVVDANKMQAEAEAKQRAIQQAKAEQEARERAKLEAEQRAEQERLAAIEAEKAKAEAAEKAREEAAKAKAEAAEKAREEAAKAKAEAAEKAREEAAKAKAEAAEKAREEAAKAKAEAAEKAREEAAKAKAEAAAKAKAELQAEMEAEAETKATEQQAELALYSKKIKKQVENVWLRPADVEGKLKCTIRVKLTSDGTVMAVEIINSSGDEKFDQSAKVAVTRASPLPVPKDRELFDREFRTFKFEFKPE